MTTATRVAVHQVLKTYALENPQALSGLLAGLASLAFEKTPDEVPYGIDVLRTLLGYFSKCCEPGCEEPATKGARCDLHQTPPNDRDNASAKAIRSAQDLLRRFG